jgi:hypothetical protein
MAGKLLIMVLSVVSLAACTRDGKPDARAQRTSAPVIVRSQPKVMTDEQKARLDFPADVISQVEAAAQATAEPFFEEVMMRSANLKGDVMLSAAKLSGFSVHTRRADEVIAGLLRPFRSRGFLIFRSEQNFGTVPDVVTVVRGQSSYDILKVQRTEAPRYRLDTQAIIRWLRERQRDGTFVITGAGADWVEATFVRPPKNMHAFARRVAAFAPDVLRDGTVTVEKLSDQMVAAKGFQLVWE